MSIGFRGILHPMPSPKSAAVFACCVTALVPSACTFPGEGPKALAGFKASAAIIHGLGEYHSKNATYPDTLQLLVPTFLTSDQLTPPRDITGYDYRREEGAGFTFGFKYTGPGANTCTFASSSRSWHCSGLY